MLALLSGVLLFLSFPSFGHPAFAWVALLPLLVTTAHASSVFQAFRRGLLTGVVHFVGTIYWIPRVMEEFGGLSATVSWGVHLLLVGYLALFPALFAVAIWILFRRFGAAAVLAAPAVWVTSELGRIYLFTGFPWELLGYSQTSVLWVAQLASVVGVLGLSALVASVSGALAYFVLAGWRRASGIMIGTATLIVVCLLFGNLRVRSGGWAELGVPLRVSAVQGNIAQDDKWDPGLRDTILEKYLVLTHRAADEGANLVVWPEAATPFTFQIDARSERIRHLVRERGIHLLLGTTDVTWDDEPRYYNAAVLVDQTGATAGIYHKQHLVPFGEYVPMRDLLSFVSPIVENIGGFAAGDASVTLMMDDHPIGVVVCYEIIYPELVRRLVIGGSRLLMTVSNDAWYGQTAAPYQHFQQATMRAIEQGRFLVRAANTGVSGVIDPYGRVIAQTALFEDDVLTTEVRLIEDLTLYTRYGDLLAFACGIMTLVILIVVGVTQGIRSGQPYTTDSMSPGWRRSED
jgi:apolipoprotein N-acyltransferase